MACINHTFRSCPPLLSGSPCTSEVGMAGRSLLHPASSYLSTLVFLDAHICPTLSLVAVACSTRWLRGSCLLFVPPVFLLSVCRFPLLGNSRSLSFIVPSETRQGRTTPTLNAVLCLVPSLRPPLHTTKKRDLSGNRSRIFPVKLNTIPTTPVGRCPSALKLPSNKIHPLLRASRCLISLRLLMP